MVAHNAHTRNSSSLLLFVIFGLSLLTIAVVWARLLGQDHQNTVGTSFQTYSSPKYHFSVGYPQSWQLQAAPDDSNVVTLSSFVEQKLGNGGRLYNTSLPLNMSKIDIMAFDVEAGTSAQAFMQAQTGTVPVTSTNISRVRLDNEDAFKIAVATASNLLDGNESSLAYTSLYMTKGTHGYIVAGYAQPELFNQIISTFHVN